MEQIARPLSSRPTDTSSQIDAVRTACRESLPGMTRYVRARLSAHGHPVSPETIREVLEASYTGAIATVQPSHAAVEARSGNASANPAGAGAGGAPAEPITAFAPQTFRKVLAVRARAALAGVVERDQRAYLGAAAQALATGEAQGWKCPVPPRSLGKLAETVLSAIDTAVPTAPGRILLRGLLSGTQTLPRLSRLLDTADLAPLTASSLAHLADALPADKLASLPGLLQSLRDAPGAPPAALLSARPDNATEQRVLELHLLAQLEPADIARRVGKKEDQVLEILAGAGVAAGPWQKVGAMQVDLAGFTRELEMRDLAAYVEQGSEGDRPATAMPQNWSLFNRHLKVVAFWVRTLLTRVASTTFGPGLAGPWIHARLAAAGAGARELRTWLDQAGAAPADLGRLPPRAKLPRELVAVLAPAATPPGPDLTRPLAAPARLAPTAAPSIDPLLSRLLDRR